MEIHGISLETIKSLSEAEWEKLDEPTKEEFQLILSYEHSLPDNFVDEKLPSGIWNSDFIMEYVVT